MALNNSTFENIQNIVGAGYCSRKKEDLACYSYDATSNRCLPDAVVFPKDAGEISKIIKLANSEEFYVIPRGSGSGMTGVAHGAAVAVGVARAAEFAVAASRILAQVGRAGLGVVAGGVIGLMLGVLIVFFLESSPTLALPLI